MRGWMAGALAVAVGCGPGLPGEVGPPGPAGEVGPVGPSGPAGSLSCPQEVQLDATGSGLAGYAALTGILGEATASAFVDEIVLLGLRAGFVPTLAEGCEALGVYNRFVLVKQADRASAPLLARLADGAPIDTAVISLVTVGQQPIQRWTLSQARVERVRTAWASGVPVEEVTLSFERLELRYWRQNASGQFVAEPPFCWDLVAAADCSS
jgi:type VI protein secretion system component Hcp